MGSYKGYKKTNLITYEFGKHKRVYKKDGRLFFRHNNNWLGTFENYCRIGSVRS